jgi:hypothetical protein
MSEEPTCPYCGAAVRTEKVMDYDNKIKLRCSTCGGFFEFLPGFGAFSLPEEERTGSRSSVRHEGFMPDPRYDVYEADAPWGSERLGSDAPPVQGSSCGTACFVISCLCCFIPILTFIMMIVLGVGLFWF